MQRRDILGPRIVAAHRLLRALRQQEELQSRFGAIPGLLIRQRCEEAFALQSDTLVMTLRVYTENACFTRMSVLLLFLRRGLAALDAPTASLAPTWQAE